MLESGLRTIKRCVKKEAAHRGGFFCVWSLVAIKRWSEGHRLCVLRYLELYIFPHIDSSDIRQLKTSHLLAPTKKLMPAGRMTLLSVFSSVSGHYALCSTERLPRC